MARYYHIIQVCAFIWVRVVIAVAQNDNPCTQTHNGQPTVPHHQRDGSVYCCIRRQCNQGTYPVCDPSQPATRCVICPANHYRPHAYFSDTNNKCLTKTKCPQEKGSVVLNEGSRDKDRKCGCKLEEGFYDYDYDDENHTQCHLRVCDPGLQLTIKGICEKCPFAQFKAERGYEPCKPWTECDVHQKIIVGNTTADAQCVNKTIVVPPRVGKTLDRNESDGAPYEMIFGILGGVLTLVIVFAVLLYILHRCRYRHDPDGEKQTIHSIQSTPISARLPPLNIPKAKMDMNGSKVRHGSSPDSGIADMKGYAPYFPGSSEKLSCQSNGNCLQYAKDIQEDCGSMSEDHNNSFHEPIPEEDENKGDDSHSVDTLNDGPAVINHYYYFPQRGNVNLQLGSENKLYVGGAPTDSPPCEDYPEYNPPLYNPTMGEAVSPVHNQYEPPERYNVSKQTVV